MIEQPSSVIEMPPVTTTYEAVPFRPRPEVMSTILRGIAASDGHFSRFDKLRCTAEDGPCYTHSDIDDMCDACKGRIIVASVSLTRPSMRAWEVWRTAEDIPVLTGIVILSEIQPGIDANAHYVFFDRDLRGKTALLRSLIEWAFSEHEDWLPLQRVTLEIPFPAFALARHAAKKLGFGGPHQITYAGKPLAVEGMKTRGTRWDGSPADLLILGLVNEH
jgi:hypothetical protein